MIVALLGVIGVMLRQGNTVRAATDAVAPRETAAGEQKEAAQDSTAKSLLRNAAISMESLYADQQDFANATTAVERIEPNITWVGRAQADPRANEVALTVGSDNSSYQLVTTSGSGVTLAFSRDARVNIERTCGPGCTWSTNPICHVSLPPREFGKSRCCRRQLASAPTANWQPETASSRAR